MARKIETLRGGAWTPVQVTDLLKRLDRVAAGASRIARFHRSGKCRTMTTGESSELYCPMMMR